MKNANIDFLKLPKNSTARRQPLSNYSIRLDSIYRSALEDPILKEKFISSLEQDSRIMSMQGKLLNFGCGAEAFEFDRLAMWLLWMINEHGEKFASDALNNYLDNDHVCLQENLWVSGFRINEEVIVDDFIKIVPIELMPESECKEVFSAWPPNFVRWEHELPEVCIVASYRAPKFVPNEDLTCEERITLIKKILKISELINVFNKIYSFSYLLQSSISLDIPYGAFHTGNGSRSLNDVLGLNFNSTIEIEGTEINELLLAYEAIPNDLKAIVDIAISRLSQAKRRKSINDKLLDLGIVLDALLVLKNEHGIGKKISERGSTIAEKRGWSFQKSRDLLRNIYKLRSEVVHDGFIDNGRRVNNISEELKLVEDILKELIFSQNFYWR